MLHYKLRCSVQAITLVAAAFAPVLANGQSLELLHLYERMRYESSAGNAAGATMLAREALELGGKELGPRSADTAALNLSLAELLLEQDNLDEAARRYRNALSIMEQLLGSEHPDLAPILLRLAEIATRSSDFAAAEIYLLRAVTIEQAVYGDNHPNIIHGLELLAAVYRDAERHDEADALAARVQDLRSRPTVLDSFRTTGKPRGSAGPVPRRFEVGDGEGEFAIVRVFYGTDRARTGKTILSDFYGSERGDLEYGYLDVSIPATHEYGELESPSRIWIFGAEENPKKHVVLLAVEPAENKDTFLASLRRNMAEASSDEVFVFVHGYNVSFEAAARRTAQLAYDLEFDGTPILYSWPSQNSTAGYFADEASVRVSARKLRVFLENLVEDSGASRIHLIAHSMGNRAMVEALEQLVLRRDPSLPREVFDQVVLAAPDIDIDLFEAISAEIQQAARRVTLYASANDKALQYSAQVHGGIPRAGSIVEDGRGIVVLPGLDTIDMSDVETGDYGHSYYGDDEATMFDLVLLMWRGVAPEQRCGMYPREIDHSGYWRFQPEECRDEALLKAAVLVKRFGKNARTKVERWLATTSKAESDDERGTWLRILRKIDQLVSE
jgi:esterase/lipase superfamily enzyme